MCYDAKARTSPQAFRNEGTRTVSQFPTSNGAQRAARVLMQGTQLCLSTSPKANCVQLVSTKAREICHARKNRKTQMRN